MRAMHSGKKFNIIPQIRSAADRMTMVVTTKEKRMKYRSWGFTVWAMFTGVMVLGLVDSGHMATAQEQMPIRPNASYQCSNGMTVTVTRCALQAGKEYCEFKVERDGKLAYQGVNLREQVAVGVKSCTAQAAGSSPRTMAEPGRSFNPPYLNEMPSIDLVKQEIQGKDPTDTLARQVAVFNKLPQVITSFMLADRKRYDLTPDEQKVTGKYNLAAYELEQGYKKSHTPAEAQAFLQLHGRYEMDAALNREMHLKLFSPAFLQQMAHADKTWTEAYQAHLEQERRTSEQANAGQSGASAKNNPGTLAARRCMELGGSELECVGKGFWTGLMDMAGVNAGAVRTWGRAVCGSISDRGVSL